MHRYIIATLTASILFIYTSVFANTQVGFTKSDSDKGKTFSLMMGTYSGPIVGTNQTASLVLSKIYKRKGNHDEDWQYKVRGRLMIKKFGNTGFWVNEKVKDVFYKGKSFRSGSIKFVLQGNGCFSYTDTHTTMAGKPYRAILCKRKV